MFTNTDNTGMMGKAGRTLRALAAAAMTASLVALVAGPFSAGLASADGGAQAGAAGQPGTPTMKMVYGHLLFEGGTDSGWLRPTTISLFKDGQEIVGFDVLLGPDGKFSFGTSDQREGTYKLWLKTSRFLAAEADVKFYQGAAGVELTMIAGDADDNNVITAVDYSIMRNALGTVKGDPKYDDRADFNYNGKVDKLDMELLTGKNGKTGAARPK